MGNAEWGMGSGSGGKGTRGQGDKENGRREMRRQGDLNFSSPCLPLPLSPCLPLPLSPCLHSPCPLVPLPPIPLFPFLFTGYIWSYQNSRSFFRAIKSQTDLRGWIM